MCPVNTYADAPSTVSCAACAQHSQAPAASDAQTDCLCSTGFAGPSGGPCAECQSNQYANAMGMASCTACLANSEAR
jgi:hypothetical protein